MSLQGALASLKIGEVIARGRMTPTSGSDNVITGLGKLSAVFVSLAAAPNLTHMFTSGDIGDQDGSPALGTFNVISKKPTGTGDVTPVDATTPWVDVEWVAIGLPAN